MRHRTALTLIALLLTLNLILYSGIIALAAANLGLKADCRLGGVGHLCRLQASSGAGFSIQLAGGLSIWSFHSGGASDRLWPR
jgi:hypothetical protein